MLKAPTATPPTIMPVVSTGADMVGRVLGVVDGYGIIINRGDEDADADPFVGHGVIRTKGVEEGVSTAVGVEDG